MAREVIVGAAAEQAVIKKLPSRRVWPTAKAPLATAPSLKMGCGILPDGDNIEELSMKAPMSVSKPADLGLGVPNCASRRMVIGDKGHDVFTQVRALSMEVKPYSFLINIDDMASTRVDLPREASLWYDCFSSCKLNLSGYNGRRSTYPYRQACLPHQGKSHPDTGRSLQSCIFIVQESG